MAEIGVLQHIESGWGEDFRAALRVRDHFAVGVGSRDQPRIGMILLRHGAGSIVEVWGRERRQRGQALALACFDKSVAYELGGVSRRVRSCDMAEILDDIKTVVAPYGGDADDVEGRIEKIGAVMGRAHENIVGAFGTRRVGNVFSGTIEWEKADERDTLKEGGLTLELVFEPAVGNHETGMKPCGFAQGIIHAHGGIASLLATAVNVLEKGCFGRCVLSGRCCRG